MRSHFNSKLFFLVSQTFVLESSFWQENKTEEASSNNYLKYFLLNSLEKSRVLLFSLSIGQ